MIKTSQQVWVAPSHIDPPMHNDLILNFCSEKHSSYPQNNWTKSFWVVGTIPQVAPTSRKQLYRGSNNLLILNINQEKSKTWVLDTFVYFRIPIASLGSELTPWAPSLSTWALLALWAGSVLVVGSRPVHCRMFSSSSTIYLVAASSISFSVVTTKISPHCQMSPGGQNQPQLRIAILLFRSNHVILTKCLEAHYSHGSI